jgi:hypothetical protein
MPTTTTPGSTGSGEKNMPAEFVLDYLPPYSPELNAIERVGELTRRFCLHNQYFPLLQEVLTTVEAEFVGWAYPNETLRLIMRNYLSRYV